MISQSEEQIREDDYLKYVIEVIDREVLSRENGLSQAISQSRSHDYSDSVVGARLAGRHQEVILNLRSQRGKPYFGRIDFEANGESTGEVIYVGLGPLHDDEELIHDWRAPLGSLYYRGSTGPASYSAPGGQVSGVIRRRRQYEISDGLLITFYEQSLESPQSSGAAKGTGAQMDPMLLAMLQRNSSGQMRQIVQSIQSEQDRVVRSDAHVLIVQGPAGSGKTVVALHRAAYLLYHLRLKQERSRTRYTYLSANNMLVLSPNAVFSDYISSVLPDLQEGQIQQTVFDRWVGGQIKKVLPNKYRIEAKKEQYEFLLTQMEHPLHATRSAGSVLKSSLAMRDALENYIDTLEPLIEASFVSIPSTGHNQGRPIVSREEMLHQFQLARETSSLHVRLDTTLKTIQQDVEDYLKRQYGSTTAFCGPKGIFDEMKKRLLSIVRRPAIEIYKEFWGSESVHNDLSGLVDGPIGISQISEYTLDALRNGHLYYEDVLPFLLLAGCANGFPALTSVEHVIVDEGQDYSILHYEYLHRCLPKSCSLTIVGDIYQGINPLSTLRRWEDIRKVFYVGVKMEELKQSYRSSTEIMSFASRILGESTDIRNVYRSGSKPSILVARDKADELDTIRLCIFSMHEAGCESIAILCKTQDAAQGLYQSLSPHISATLLTEDSEKFAKGIFVLPIYMAKGLEFDGVLLADASSSVYKRDTERRLLYMACTRALHKLFVVYTGEPSPLLPLKDVELFDGNPVVGPSQVEVTPDAYIALHKCNPTDAVEVQGETVDGSKSAIPLTPDSNFQEPSYDLNRDLVGDRSDWPFFARDQGQFGSIPNYDAMDDESFP